MNFVSVEFAYLFLLVVPLYFLLSFRGQNVLLLAASYVFYGWWDWRFVFLMLATSLVDYTLGLNLSLARHPHRSQSVRKVLLAVSIAANLGSLGFFKYYDFFAASAMELGHSLGVPVSLPLLHVILPLGISFYTFQSMSYTIDVYRDQIAARDRLDDFLLFVSFFPHLVAGPIQRATQLLP